MMEGVQVSNEVIAEVSIQKALILLRENMMLEAALNEAHRELDRLRMMVPSDTEVTQDAASADK